MSRQPKDRARSSAGSAGAIESGGRQGETGPQARSARRKGGEGPLRGNYPRDLVGYGKRPPDPKWPGGARLALQIVMNYEEGGERSILHGDKEAEAYLQEVVGLPALQGVRNLQVESMYEYGSRVGFWRLMRTFASYGIKISIFAVAMAAPFAGLVEVIVGGGKTSPTFPVVNVLVTAAASGLPARSVTPVVTVTV